MTARSRRSRVADWLLAATLLPAWLGMLWIEVKEGVEFRSAGVPVALASAASGEDYPTVELITLVSAIEGPPLARGDRILRVSGLDLRGATSLWFDAQATAAWKKSGAIDLEVQRGAEIFTTRLVPENPLWWAAIPWQVGLALAALVLLVRAPHWHLSRRYFASTLLICIGIASFPAGAHEWYLGSLVALVCYPAGLALVLSNFWQFTQSALPLRPWQRAQPWIFGLLFQANWAASYWLPALLWVGWFQLIGGLLAVFFASSLAGLTRVYRRSDTLERRQLRWVVLGAYVAYLPSGLLFAGRFLGVHEAATAEAIRLLAGVVFPLGILTSVVGYHLFDIDRLISATASYTVLGVALLGGALVVIPRVAGAAGGLVGVDPATSQWVLSLALAAVVIPAHRRLRPWIDRRFFAERVAVEEGLEQVVRGLDSCESADALIRLFGERVDEILRPESIATYTREQNAFTPVFARGRALPPAFAVESLLVRALQARTTPLAASSARLDPFDRAALETLGAEVVIPVRRGAALVAFSCLGAKGSGDIYVPAELALLAAIASKTGDVLQRIDAGELLRQARALHDSLRRYVPGAVAEKIERGSGLEAGEVEVSVLFVDIRGYTSFADARRAGDVFSSVNEHTERVSQIVRERGGAVVEFNGDGMMAVFGAPEELAQKERRAVEAAREIVDSTRGALPVGVGVATGAAYSGNIRAADRWIWSVIGSTTNLAARLQTLTRDLGASIAVDDVTRQAAGYVCGDFVHHADVPIRGRLERLDIWTLPLAGATPSA